MVSVEPAVVVERSMNSPPADAAAADVEARKTEAMITNLQLQSVPIPIINLDKGDPTMYEAYWKSVGEEFKISISGSQFLSYLANPKSLCWFLMPKLEQQIKVVHDLVGNSVVEDRHIVVGNGSSQLIQAALYALAEPLNSPTPISVVSAAPFYSCYPQIADCVKSGLFRWAGDAKAYESHEPYIELVTSPNNPDGEIRGSVVNRPNGMLIHDLAYYWPQYTPITAPADHDVMLFTLSKCTGHAGSRIGWAIVKDAEVAKKMIKFIEINTIGVSKEAQLRAASILEMISTNGCSNNFFKFGHSVMAERWKKLKEALKESELLQVPNFPIRYCNFNRYFVGAYPAYAWMKGKEGVDLEKVMSDEKIQVRGGKSFGCPSNYVRVSILGRDQDFQLFLMMLPSIIQLLAD